MNGHMAESAGWQPFMDTYATYRASRNSASGPSQLLPPPVRRVSAISSVSILVELRTSTGGQRAVRELARQIRGRDPGAELAVQRIPGSSVVHHRALRLIRPRHQRAVRAAEAQLPGRDGRLRSGAMGRLPGRGNRRGLVSIRRGTTSMSLTSSTTSKDQRAQRNCTLHERQPSAMGGFAVGGDLERVEEIADQLVEADGHHEVRQLRDGEQLNAASRSAPVSGGRRAAGPSTR